MPLFPASASRGLSASRAPRGSAVLRTLFASRAPRGPAVLRTLLALALLPPLAACASGGATPPAAATPSGGPADDGPRPYARVVTPDAVSDSGLFVVHRIGDRLLFEVPDSLLGREMLLVSRIARVPADFGGYLPAGVSAHEQVLVFERRGGRVMLRKRSYEQVAPDSLPIAVSVVNNNLAPIVAAFDVEARTPDDAGIVIDVTEFYEGDTPAIGGLSQAQRREYGVRSLDGDRSFINYARAWPRNVDVRHTTTFEATSPPSDENTGTLSLEMHQSLVLLPKEPMRPRHADPRVGYFSVRQVNYGVDAQKAAEQTFIRRWRLEPRDSAAYARGELSEPVTPITWYLDPATPAEWRSCVRQGVEDWNAAFETAGFRDAVRALDPPPPSEDPDWDPEDVRHSVVRWAASLTRNAQGPSVSDPRTGEIIESDIVWYHNHMRSYRNRILLETGAANPGARSLPIDRRLMCEAMRQVIAHEIGHALGLPHNMVSSSAYPVDSLRTRPFAARMGVAPSIMDYARQNYIAQPGDGLEGEDFIRQIGPYDHHAIQWGYRVLPGAATPEDERPTLNRWILERAHDPVYRFLPGDAARFDPRAQTEDLGDDPVRASGYGIANLKKVAPRLVEWTSRAGEGYADLEELYGELVGQWSRYVGHVAALVGGVHAQPKSGEQEGVVFTPVPRARQEEAVRFLGEEAFRGVAWLNDPGILRRIEATGALERVAERQARILGSLLEPGRLARLQEAEVLTPAAAYPLAAYLEDLEAEVWSELDDARPVGPYRRALQREYLERVKALIESPEEEDGRGGAAPALARSDARPLARARLRDLAGRASSAAGRTDDASTRVHLEDVAERIARILEGEAR